MKLTPFEIVVLRWMTLGKTPAEIAKIEGKSAEAINTHLQTVMSKLQVQPRAAVTEEANAMETTRTASSSGDRLDQGGQR